jgi:nicotinamidase-related amidase
MELFLQNRLNSDGKLDPKSLAVLAVHWQNDLVLPEGKFGFFAQEIARLGLVPRMAKLLKAVRAAGGTVIYVNVARNPGARDVIKNSPIFLASSKVGAFLRGTKGIAVIDELAPGPDDFQVDHPRISAFFGNELDLLLRAREIRTVVVAGTATNVAIDSSVRDSLQLGYDTILLEDCCCSSSPDFHEAALKTMRVLATWVATCDEFLARLPSINVEGTRC